MIFELFLLDSGGRDREKRLFSPDLCSSIGERGIRSEAGTGEMAQAVKIQHLLDLDSIPNMHMAAKNCV